MFNGTGTALITPFFENGKIDYKSLDNLIEFQISNNIDALVILGTTGEPPTMTEKERNQVLKFCIKKIANRVPVIAGVGCNCTKDTIRMSKNAEKFGADGLLIVTPYYNKCTQNGLYLHYKGIAEAVNIPIIAYNVPGRTGVNILPLTAKRLTDVKNIVGIKEACGNLDQIKETIEAVKGSDINIFSGDDGLAIDIIKLGARGLISVASNVIPQQMHDLTTFALNGNIAEAEKMSKELAPLFADLFIEVNPIPVKYACYKLNLCQNVLRMPLTPLSADCAIKLESIMKSLNILK